MALPNNMQTSRIKLAFGVTSLMLLFTGIQMTPAKADDHDRNWRLAADHHRNFDRDRDDRRINRDDYRHRDRDRDRYYHSSRRDRDDYRTDGWGPGNSGEHRRFPQHFNKQHHHDNDRDDD